MEWRRAGKYFWQCGPERRISVCRVRGGFRYTAWRNLRIAGVFDTADEAKKILEIA